MTTGTYRVIVADPPWQYPDEELWGRPEVADHYCTLPTADICTLPVERFAHPDGCALFLWTTNRHLLHGDAMRVARAWGFELKQQLVWAKPQLGLGRLLRMAHESALLCTRGTVEVRDHGVPSWFVADRRGHSEKPHEFYALVERAFAGPYLDLFARVQRTGWDVLGDELTPDLFDRSVGWPDSGEAA